MKVLTRSKRPNHRLTQWTSPSGLRSAKSLFKSPEPEPRKANVASSVGSHKSSRPKHPLASSMVPPATSNKRKLKASDATPDVPAKRRQVSDSTEEQKSSGWFSGWWTKKMDPWTVTMMVTKLSKELLVAEANLQTIRSQMHETTEHFRIELKSAEAEIQAIKFEKDKIEDIIKRY